MCQKGAATYVAQIEPQYRAFLDELVIAESSPRLSLSASARRLQDIARRIEMVEGPDCAWAAITRCHEGMRQVINGLLDFVAATDNIPAYRDVNGQAVGKEDLARAQIVAGRQALSRALVDIVTLSNGGTVTR